MKTRKLIKSTWDMDKGTVINVFQLKEIHKEFLSWYWKNIVLDPYDNELVSTVLSSKEYTDVQIHRLNEIIYVYWKQYIKNRGYG